MPRRRRATPSTNDLTPPRSFGRLGLLGQFALVSFVIVLALGLLLSTVLHRIIEDRALERAEQQAHSIGQLAVLPLLEPDDFAVGRIDDVRIAQLDRDIAEALDSQIVSRVKLFGVAGHVVYSDEHDIIGTPFNPGIEKDIAFAGSVTSELRDPEGDDEHATEASLGRLLEVYHPVPMDVDGEERIVGALEVYFPYEPVAEAIAADERVLRWVLAIGLVALWVGLFKLVSRASRALRLEVEHSRYLALHDQLTGVANRRLFTDRAQQSIAAAKRSDGRVAVLLIDIDRFKDVNDTLGHGVGDSLLRAVAARIGELVREADTVARVGGDEFAVLMPTVEDATSPLDLAHRVLMALRRPFVVDEVVLEVEASIGVAGFPEHSDDVDRLLQCANVSLQTAKSEQAGVVGYADALDDHAPQRVALFGELRRAIDEAELVVHYQPKADVAAGRVAGVEALIRWEHPVRGMLYPDVFLGVAERTGLIRPLTGFVLDRTLRDCRSWRDAGLELTVAVNLSARNLLDPSLPEQVRQLLARHDLPPQVLELEITESTAMVDPETSLRVLHELSEVGVGLAVDDYGTGHASLAYLSRLPVDELKIDRSFVMQMTVDDKSDVIVRSTIDLGRRLGLRVVAEGVECAEAYQRLRELGCDAAQGYWLARPCPFAEVTAAVDTVDELLRSSPVAAGHRAGGGVADASAQVAPSPL